MTEIALDSTSKAPSPSDIPLEPHNQSEDDCFDSTDRQGKGRSDSCSDSLRGEYEYYTGTFEHFCVFFMAVGVSIGFTSVLSAVNYFSMTLFHDRREFLLLCCAVYLPSLPVVVFQLKYERVFDRKVGSRRAYAIKAAIYYIAMGLIMIYIPLGPGSRQVTQEPIWHRQPPLLLAATLLGFISASSYGSWFQLVSFLPSENGACTAIFSMGYQGAGIIAAFLAISIGFRTNPSQSQVNLFFMSAAALEFFAGACYFIMASYSTVFKRALTDRDREASIYLSARKSSSSRFKMTPPAATESTWLLSLKSEEKCTLSPSQHKTEEEKQPMIDCNQPKTQQKTQDLGDLENKNHPPPSVSSSSESKEDWELFWVVFPCVASIFINIFASVFLLPFYTFFPSKYMKLPQVLFFTKLFADTLGRPLTLLVPVKNQNVILGASVVRVCFLGVFMAEILGFLEWNNTTIITMVALFSTASGLIGTSAYQLAPSLVTGSFRKTQVASMLNLGFHLAVTFALLSSAAVAPLLMPYIEDEN